MSLIKSIYNAPMTYKYDGIFSSVTIIYNGKKYYGAAVVHSNDKDFASEKVGLNIALSRARIKILEDMLVKTKQIADIKYQYYQEAINYGAVSSFEVDPSGAFYNKVIKAKKSYYKIQNALHKEKSYLNKYLEDQSKVVERVKIFRAKKEEK